MTENHLIINGFNQQKVLLYDAVVYCQIIALNKHLFQ